MYIDNKLVALIILWNLWSGMMLGLALHYLKKEVQCQKINSNNVDIQTNN